MKHPDYYHKDNDVLMSNSQWKHWLECRARAHAMFVSHTWQEDIGPALAVGAMVDAILTDEDNFLATIEEYKDILELKSGKPSQYYKQGMALAQRVKAATPVYSLMQDCDQQAEYCFSFAGVEWKCRLDLFHRDSWTVLDLKTTADMHKTAYVPRLGTHGNFIAQYDYCRQLALYREAVRQNEDSSRPPKAGIIAVDKHPRYPDLAVMMWHDDYYWQFDDALLSIQDAMEEVHIARTTDDPSTLYRCGSCDYCRATRTDYVQSYYDPENPKQYNGPQRTNLTISL